MPLSLVTMVQHLTTLTSVKPGCLHYTFRYKGTLAETFIHSNCLVQVLVLIYTVIPLPLYGTLIVGLLYTCLLEILAGLILYNSKYRIPINSNVLK